MSACTRCVLFLALLVSAGPAAAGTFNLIARLSVGTVSGFDMGYTATGAASGLISEGGGIAQVPAGLFSQTVTGLVTPPQSGVNGFTVNGGGLPGGTLDAAAASNVMPLQGSLGLRAGTIQVGSVPLSPIGGGGTAMAVVLGVIPVTLAASPWLLGVHTVTGTGPTPQTVMVTGFDQRTVLGLGRIQFVSPQSAALPVVPSTVPSASILELVYVPVAEPTQLGLFGAGCIGVLGAARRRRRSSSS